MVDSKGGIIVITGAKRMHGDIIFTRIKKHFCPTCNKKLELKACSKVVNSKAEDAKNYDFSFGESFLVGNVKFTWDELQCPKCKKQFTIDEVRQHENVSTQMREKLLGRYRNKKEKNLYAIIAVAVLLFVAVSIINGVGSKSNYCEKVQTNSVIPVRYIINENPLYVYLKKHLCPGCRTKLETAYSSIIVNSNSPEAVDYDFSNGDVYWVGDVEFRTLFFKCPGCGYEIAFDEMRRLEEAD